MTEAGWLSCTDLGRLAVLADALEEAGRPQAAPDADLLAHLRSRPHVRGCWALDVAAGKESGR